MQLRMQAKFWGLAKQRLSSSFAGVARRRRRLSSVSMRAKLATCRWRTGRASRRRVLPPSWGNDQRERPRGSRDRPKGSGGNGRSARAGQDHLVGEQAVFSHPLDDRPCVRPHALAVCGGNLERHSAQFAGGSCCVMVRYSPMLGVSTSPSARRPTAGHKVGGAPSLYAAALGSAHRCGAYEVLCPRPCNGSGLPEGTCP